MNYQFKPGDTVKYKGNNMRMTIKAIETSAVSGTGYRCIWYDNATVQQAVFTEDVLELLAPDCDMLHFANYE